MLYTVAYTVIRAHSVVTVRRFPSGTRGTHLLSASLAKVNPLLYCTPVCLLCLAVTYLSAGETQPTLLTALLVLFESRNGKVTFTILIPRGYIRENENKNMYLSLHLYIRPKLLINIRHILVQDSKDSNLLRKFLQWKKYFNFLRLFF